MGILDRAKSVYRGFASPATVAPHTATDSAGANALAAAPRFFGNGTGVLTNLLSGLNTTEDQTWWDVWYQRRTLTDQQRTALGSDPLVHRILSLPGEDATREGWTTSIQGDRPQSRDAIAEAIRDYEQRDGIDLVNKLRDASTRSRQYGASIIVLGIDDGRLPSEPVDVENIKRVWWAGVIDWRDFDYGKVVDARGRVVDFASMDPESQGTFAPGAQRFGSVATYYVNDLNGVLPDGIRRGDYLTHAGAINVMPTTRYEIHADRVLYLAHDRALPMTDQIQDAMAAYFRGMSGISRAIDRASLFVWKVANHVAQSWSENAGIGERRIRNAMRSWSSLSAIVLDSKDEDFQSIGSGSTSGLADAIHPVMLWICAISAIPSTRLFGMSPGGFGKGDAEQQQWLDVCRAYQQTLTPLVRKFDRYAAAAKDGGINLIVPTGEIEIEWADLDPATEAEKAEIFSKRATAAALLVERGILLESEAIGMFPEIARDDAERLSRAARGQTIGAMPVGVFTGILSLMTEGTMIPASQRRALAEIADPERITAAKAALLFPDAPAPTPAMPGAPAVGSPDLADGKGGDPVIDASTPRPPAPRPTPPDVVDGAKLAAELGIPSVRLTNAVKRGELRNYDMLGGRPVYSRGEVMDLIRVRNLTAEEREAEELAAAEEADLVAAEEAANSLPDLEIDASDDANAERIADAFKRYHETVNMGASELREWAATEWSKAASVSREPIDRNLRLLETPREDWTLATASSALRTVSFVSRMKGAEQGKPVKIDGREGPSKRDISLRNWAYNPAA